VKSQKNAFLEYEANSYFARNQAILATYTTEKDPIVNTLKDYKYQPKRVLEIGCNAGYRLNGIKTLFPDCEVYGIEPSSNAIAYGKRLIP
jgi:SAM-dependent methyltransferase